MGVLKGHRNWVTGIATCFENPNAIISSSRDKTVMVWELTPQEDEQDLGLGEQERPGRDLPGGEEQDGPPVVGFDDLECGREHALRGKHGWRHLRLRHHGLRSARVNFGISMQMQ